MWVLFYITVLVYSISVSAWNEGGGEQQDLKVGAAVAAPDIVLNSRISTAVYLHKAASAI
jgi:hypothetical protein